MLAFNNFPIKILWALHNDDIAWTNNHFHSLATFSIHTLISDADLARGTLDEYHAYHSQLAK